MRVLQSIVCCAVACLMHGCGSGGNDKVNSCLASKVNVVSQAVTGTVILSSFPSIVATDIPVIIPTTVSTTVMSDFVMKFDLENLNLRFDVSPLNGVIIDNVTVLTNMTMLVNILNNSMVMYASAQETNASRALLTTTTCCSDVLSDKPLPTQQLRQALSMGLSALQKSSTCEGNDGTYDTWRDHKSVTESVKDVEVSAIMDLELTVTKDALWHAMRSSLSGSVSNSTDSTVEGSFNVSIDVDVSESSAGGPSVSDLDPQQFGISCDETCFDDDTPMVASFRKHALVAMKVFQSHQLTMLM